MKKTLTIVLALLLVVCFCFALVACNGGSDTTTTTDDGGNNGGNNGGSKNPTQEDIKAAQAYESYMKAYLTNNPDATVSDLSNVWTAAKVLDAYSGAIKGVTAKAVSGGVEFTVQFKDKTVTTFTVNKVAKDEGFYAGSEFSIKETTTFDAAFVAVYNAAMKTIETAVNEGNGFEENGFGFAGEAWFQFNYGELTSELLSYGLRVKGNIGVEAKDTAVSLEIIDKNYVLGGLYYQGAATKADCKIYLKYTADKGKNYTKYYIDNADINAIVASMIPSTVSEAIASAAEETEEPFYKKTIATFGDLFGEGSQIGGYVLPIIDVLFEEGTVGYTNVTGGKKYQVNISIDDLLATLMDTFGDFLAVLDLSTMPEPINQLKLDSFSGIGGTLLITATVKNSGELGEVELSYNCNKQDFRWSAQDADAKPYGPVNVALGIKDFAIGAQDLDVALDDASYFSPLNSKITADIEVNEVAYTVDAISEFNPFNMEEGKASVLVKKGEVDFLNVYFAMREDGDCDVVVEYEGTVYRTLASDIDFGTPAENAWNILSGENTMYQPIVAYVQELLAMWFPKENKDTQPTQQIAAANDAADEEGGFGFSNIMDMVGVYNTVKEIVEGWNGTVYTYTTNPVSFKLDLDYTQYNEILEAVMPAFEGLLPEEVTSFLFTEDAATIQVAYNTADYTDIAICIVKYDGVSYIAKVDMTEFDIKTKVGVLEASFTIKNGEGEEAEESVYKVVFNNSTFNDDGIATVVYTADETEYVNATLNYNKTGKSTVTLVLSTDVEDAHTFVFSAEDIEGGMEFGAILDGIEMSVYGKNGYFKYEDVGTTSFGIPQVEMGCEFGYSFPSGNVAVKVNKIKLVNWGQAVTAKVAPAPAPTDVEGIDTLLNDLFEGFANIFVVPEQAE